MEEFWLINFLLKLFALAEFFKDTTIVLYHALNLSSPVVYHMWLWDIKQNHSTLQAAKMTYIKVLIIFIIIVLSL